MFDRITNLDLIGLVCLTEKLGIKIIEPKKNFSSEKLPFHASRSSVNRYEQ
ncbi:MAG: hypothetical protein MRERC_7c070 [Mycoplasmataceae bacterium RC_NB112A]|nr:MAG: hypothetical protein MRERC_8c069 [Mycoplasmataceae bacterium RC_NB112A]KLL01905.1 MAG: hypothetical protein MRERC_7c070 [Mycoplasmataceae bacterium RC_NB112A]